MRSGSSSSPNSTRPATPLYESDFIPQTSRAARAGWHVLDRRSWSTREELRLAIVSWIEGKYHRKRRQRRLGKLTPVEFELIMKPTATLAA